MKRFVLVVEDDADVRETLELILSTAGYAVLTAPDGTAAMEILRAHNDEVGLILLDVLMPNMDGWQFLARRDRDPVVSGIPVFLISGQVDAGEAARRWRLVGHADKPLDVATLLSRVERHARAA